MKTKKILFVFLIAVIFFSISVPASAQMPGDLDCDGSPWTIGDAVIAARILIESCDMDIFDCTFENGDLDGDGLSLTLGDLLMIMIINPYYYPQHPESDTIMVGSAIAHPGETLVLPLWIKTVDIIVGFQFLLEVNTDYIEFDTLIIHNDFQFSYSICDGNIYCVTYPAPYYPIIYEPGNYHIGDLVLNVNPDINEPVTTGLVFSSSPPQALYTGFANTTFFLPVMVDAEIQIIPMTSVDQPDEIMPREMDISVYPNPFNGNTNISVTSENAGELSIYDILGRPVRSFGISPSANIISWDAKDDFGQPIKSGVYFIGLNNGRGYSFKKVLYLK